MSQKALASQLGAFPADEARPIRAAHRLVWVIFALLMTGLVWAKFAVLDEVSTGTARVVPTSREQVIQSLEGGILSRLDVRPDMVVEVGQVLAQLDTTRGAAEAEETASAYRAALAAAARLRAEASGQALKFPPELADYPSVTTAERALFDERRQSHSQKLEMLDKAIALTSDELVIHEKLKSTGATSTINVIQLQRQLIDLQMQRSDIAASYLLEVRQGLTEAEAEINALLPKLRSRSDVVSRLTLRSPLRGIVKDIAVSTIGGVIPPNGRLMNIIPIDDQLMIEARIHPRDIAYIRPGLRAVVKISAYDYAIYGGLEGIVETISPDTIRDEANPELLYYRVLIRTETDKLVTAAGREFPIVPGMLATVDIHTGQKTVLDYLLKPFNRASEALRER